MAEDHIAHGHHHGDDRSFLERIAALTGRRSLLGVILAMVVLTLVGLVALWPDEDSTLDVGGAVYFGERVDAEVTSVASQDCSYAIEPGQFTCEVAEFEVTSGTPAGERASLEMQVGMGGVSLSEGDLIVLTYSADAPAGGRYQFNDFQRTTPLLALALLFAVVVVAFGRWRGVFAILGVGVSMVVLVGFVLPALLAGHPPIWVALVGSSAVALPALYLAHGLSERTTVAVIGTVASLLLTCLLGWAFIGFTNLSGMASDEVGFLQALGGQLDVKGLLLAGIVIGALGVLDDVTVTQTAAVWELHAADPSATVRDLYQAGVRIGRDHIASTVNTLVLAYAGASLPLLLLFRTSEQSLAHVITGELIAVEVVRALVGSIGLVASVPITTGLAALVVSRSRPVTSPGPAEPDELGLA